MIFIKELVQESFNPMNKNSLESGGGGLKKHIPHIFEDFDLTFHDIKNILNLSFHGKLDNPKEKFDGKNLFIHWNVPENKLKVARNKTDIKSGGMDFNQLLNSLTGKPKTTIDAFMNGYNILSMALSALDSVVLMNTFANNMWFSVEIIDNNNPNVIVYDSNAIVFHNVGLDGKNTEIDLMLLYNNIDKLQNNIVDTGWKILKPVSVKLPKNKNNFDLKHNLDETIEVLNELQIIYGLNYDNTLRDLLYYSIKKDLLEEFQLPENIEELILNKLVNDSNGNIGDIKSLVNSETYSKINVLISNKEVIKNEVIKLLKELINVYSTEFLKPIQSQLIKSPSNVKANIINRIKQKKEEILASKNQKLIEELNLYIEELKNVYDKRITCHFEGIVFEYNGKLYKLTGVFGLINKILGLNKYYHEHSKWY